LNLARGAHISPGYALRKMPYLSLMAMLRVLEYEEADRQQEEREAKMKAKMEEMAKSMRGRF